MEPEGYTKRVDEKDATVLKEFSKPTTKATILVSKMYKEGTVSGGDEAKEEYIEVPVPDKSLPLAKVNYGARMVVNLGNYQTATIEVGIELPSYIPEIEEAYKAAKQFVDLRLNAEVATLREYSKKK